MRIKEVVSWDVDLGTTRPYTIAFKTVDEVRNAFVKITLENGITGIGAGNPSEYVTGESFNQCKEALQEKNLEFLIGADIREFNLLLSNVQQQFPRNPAARAALDIALHDAFTKFLDVPLVRFLGQRMHSMPTSNTIGIKGVEETIRDAAEYTKAGFTVLKIKLGKDLEEDVERLVKLREVFGSDVVLRIDANQGYTPEQTIQFYKRTLSLNLELIEQPLPAKAIEEMRRLPDEIRRVLAADESLLSSADALKLVSPLAACGIFNIKLMKCGGVSEAMKIAGIASATNTDLFWGCNDESIVSITAALHAAFANPNTRYIDLDGSLDLARDVVAGGFVLKNGVMHCLDKSGLGVELL